MPKFDFSGGFQDEFPPCAVILGTNEIVSAVAVFLHHAGWAVLLSHDPSPPVSRQGMAFHDALYGGIDILVDARMQKRETVPDFRNLARLTIGLGPGFAVGVNCDAAVETRPSGNGTLLYRGMTEPADGIVPLLGGVGAERFRHAEASGRWHTAIPLGKQVFKGMLLGRLGDIPVPAPMDGLLRGSVRDGTEVPAGAKLIEIDPRGRAARWQGIEERARRIAEATFAATGLRMPCGGRNEKFPVSGRPIRIG